MDIIKSQMKERMTTKRLTNLQKRNRLERNRQKALAQKIRKYPALCISRKFIEYAYLQRWDKEVIDAAAWVMHRYFMRCRKPNVRGWVQIPYQEFESMFGKNYTKMLYHLLSIGFLEENVKWKYAVGHHYYHYRLCKELRFDKISAKYYLQTRAYQVRFIEIKKRDIRDKKRHDCMPEQERHALVTDKMDDAFITITNSKSKHVKQDYVTPEQYGTIRTLATNANLLKIQIDDETLMDIAEKRHAQRKNPKCTLDAYVQWIQNKVNKAYIPNLRIDRYGRYYTPLTNIPREIWDYTSYRGQQLSSVDVKTSHAIVLLVLLKDIGMNYFRTDGTHEERLKQCEFSSSTVSNSVNLLFFNGLRYHFCLFLQCSMASCVRMSHREQR